MFIFIASISTIALSQKKVQVFPSYIYCDYGYQFFKDPRTDLQMEKIRIEYLSNSVSQPFSFIYPTINDLSLIKFDQPINQREASSELEQQQVKEMKMDNVIDPISISQSIFNSRNRYCTSFTPFKFFLCI